MCYNTKQSRSAEDVSKRFGATIEDLDFFDRVNQYNGFTFPRTPIITDNNPTNVQFFNWGLIPNWAHDDQIKKHTLNARIETVKEKPSFRDVVNKRCLVIANGFYEWKWLDSAGKNKQKHLLGLENDALFAFAGLYSGWVNKSTGEMVNSYTILTTESNDLMSEIHRKKRMPVVLNVEDEEAWLGGKEIAEFALPYQVDLVAKNLDNTLTLF